VLQLPHFYAAIEVTARSDPVVTLLRSIALGLSERLGQLVPNAPAEHPVFTSTTIRPEVLDADPGITWLWGVIRNQGLFAFEPLR
jgi:hypothetical protein